MTTALITRAFNGAVVSQRQEDGYINLTAMCKVCGKLFADYHRLNTTQAFLEALSTDMGINISDIVQIVKGGFPELQGTWGHPKVSIHLAQWLSPEFAVQVVNWVFEWLTTGQKPIVVSPNLPYHLQRYLANRQCVPYTHFSLLSQMSIYLTAPLENLNYTLPDNLLPDISEGLLFNRWLREVKHFDTDTLPTYVHTYEDGRQVKSKLYPLELLPDFVKHFHEVWLMQHAQNYFSGRDDSVLPLMPKLLENRLTKSLTDLLKEHNSPLSARKANQMLLELGILEEKTRASATKGTKQYKALTEQGSQYGKNVVNPLKLEETQPRYYVDTFQKLLEIMEAYLTRH